MPQETKNSAAVPREMTVARWLFNPYIRVAGGQALAVGLTVILVSGLVVAAGRRVIGAVEGSLVTPTAASLVAGLFVAACGIWMIWLMWKAFSVSCNQRGGRAVVIFAAVVAAGELATVSLRGRVLPELVVAGIGGGG